MQGYSAQQLNFLKMIGELILLLLATSIVLGQIPGTPGSWRLVTKNEKTSRSLTAGRVETFFNGLWGTVCSDGFDSTDASVLCQILTGSSRYLKYGTVESDGLGFDQGSSSVPIWMTNLECSAVYKTCTHDGYGKTYNCSHNKDVAISCLAEGAVRLSYEAALYTISPGVPVGLLEIYHSGRWGTVCDVGFDQVDADVVCQQLGYDRAHRYGNVTDIGYNYGSTRTGSSNRMIWLSNMQCTSADIFLANCSHSGFSRLYGLRPLGCSHSTDVAIECLPQLTLRLVTKRERTASYLLAGRVEVLHNGQWGTICNKGFDSIDAQVLCQRLTGSSLVLRYGEVGSYGLQFDQGPSSTPVLLENLRCTRVGFQCYHDGFGNTDCSHDRDIAISCQASGAIRLRNATYSEAGGPAGRLEFYFPSSFFLDTWSSVCATDGFDQAAADVACRQLGYEKAYKYGSVNELGYPRGSGYTTGRFKCSTNDLLLTNCTYGSYSSCYSRSGDNLIAVSCVDPGLSRAEIFGIVFGILIIICCVICQVIGIVCHKKGACTTTTTSCILPLPQGASRSHNIIFNRTIAGPVNASQTYYPNLPRRQQNDNVYITTEPSAPHLEAATHAGEAPPAYQTALHYKTVTPDVKNVRLLRDSALYSECPTTESDAPPAYKEVTGKQ